MNGITGSTSPVSKRSTSPRPPAVGEEVRKFHDTSQHCSEPYKNWNMELKTSSGESVDKSSTPACSDNVTESAECTENSPNPSPPPPYKWAQSLLCLLEDLKGVELFQQFLKQEGQDNRCLSFWFACRGVKKHDPNDREELLKLIQVVFEKKVKRISAISAETKEEIKKKLASNTDVDSTIFDAAQQEVESYIMRTTYPNFLRSDLYIQHLSGCQNEVHEEKESTVSPEPLELLPTVHEDSVLNITSSNKVPLTKQNLLQRAKFSPVSKLKQDGPAGYLRSPYSIDSNYHSKYGSFLPASAQDSELQSMSSDAQTDDTMSVTDSSSVDYPTYSRSKQKRQQKATKHVILNNDKLCQGTFIPRTARLPESLQPEDPVTFHAKVVKKLNKYMQEQKMKEKLQLLEPAECSKPEGLLYGPSEENCQDILDQHISRVFDSGQHTPAMSSGCLSPPQARQSGDALERSRVPLRGLGSYEPPQDVSFGTSYKHSQIPQQFTVPNSIKHRKDHDTHSTDRAMFDYVSDDNLPSNFRSQHSSLGNTELVDYSRRSREHSKRYASKKFSSLTDSTSSFVDSGISLACEPVAPYSKVTSWLETKRISEQEREHMWRNSSTSPIPSRPSCSRKVTAFNSRTGTQELHLQCSGQEQSMPSLPLTETTSNLIESRRRLEDESRKCKLKCASGSRNSHETSRSKFKGYETVDDTCHRKLSRKSYAGVSALESVAMCPTSNDVTVIGYSYGRRSVPYLSKLPGRNVTLRQFKSLLSKKGNFRFFFKTASNDFGTGVVFEEVTEDCKVLPMWEGKVFCVIESMDDNSVM